MSAPLALTFHQKRIWNRIHKLDEIDRETVIAHGASEKNAGSFIYRWEQVGLLEFVRKDGKNSIYRPVTKPQSLPHEATAKGNMWRAMRLLKTFTAKDIAAHSNAGGQSISIAAAGSYCGVLLAAGLLRKLKAGDTKNKATTYRLIRDLGPLAPETARVYCLQDPNSGDLFFGDQRVEL